MHDQSTIPPTKPCRTCGESKPLEDFHRDRSRPDGRRYSCKECDARADKRPEVLARKRAYWHEGGGKDASHRYYHEGKGRETRKAYNDQPDVKERRKEPMKVWTRRYRQSDKGKAWWKAYRASPARKEWEREYNRRPAVQAKQRLASLHWWYEHKEERKAYLAKPDVAARYREIARANTRRRYSRKRLLPATLTHAEWRFAVAWFDHHCAYCGSDKPLVQEHVIPVASAGAYSADNIIPACQSCNASKKDKVMEEWATPDAAERIRTYIAFVRAYNRV